MDTPGLTFAPTSVNDPSRPGGKPGSTPIQDAIRVLSLRVPRVMGARAPVARGMFSGGGNAGAPFQRPGTPGQPNVGADEVLRRLFGVFQGQPQQGGQQNTIQPYPYGSMSAPSPSLSFPVTPPNPGPIARTTEPPAPSPVQSWPQNEASPMPPMGGGLSGGMRDKYGF